MSDDLRFTYPSAPTVNVTTRRCRRHDWALLWLDNEHVWACTRCNRLRDETVTRRGKNNKKRGEAIEREIGHRLGLRRVGMYGGPDDLSGDMFAVQVKSGGSFSERYWRWLSGIPRHAGQVGVLIVTETPGRGHKARSIVVVDYDDWRDLHGEEP